MSKTFEFNAPQYIDFADLDDPKADNFFDVAIKECQNKDLISKSLTKDLIFEKSNLENTQPCLNVTFDNSSDCKKNLPVSRNILQEIFKQNYPIDSESSKPYENKEFIKENDITHAFEELQLSSKKNKKINQINTVEALESSGRKSHQMITRLDVLNNRTDIHSKSIKIHKKNSLSVSNHSSPTNEECFKISNIQSLNPTEEKIIKMKRKASPLTSTTKFISFAEQIEHFYKDTPERFRFKLNKTNKEIEKVQAKKSITYVPKTPQLSTRFRQRKVNFPNEKQREEIELEEIKKHQVKAHPLNQKILMGPSLNLRVPVLKKPSTIPQPFSLTEVKKKEQPQEPIFQFKAQPVPTVILERPVGVPPKKVLTPTIPNTPRIRVPIRYRTELKTEEKSISSDSINPPKNTKVEPFSFDKRMKETLQKKEEFIKKVIEEEKKTFNSFKAHPMPNFKNIKSDPMSKEKMPFKTIPQHFKASKGQTFIESERKIMGFTPFKAKPALVIHKKPFVPKLQKHEIELPKDFHLNTEKRAVKRLKFDEKIKEKEEEHAMTLKQQLEEEKKIEKERALEDRKKAEFKAKPMPRYKPFEIHSSDPEKLTLPQTPKFSTKIKMEMKIKK